MNFLRKRLFLLAALLLIYSVFFLTHIHVQKNATVLGTASNLFLFEEPRDGKDPILSSINSSTKEIDMEMYLLSDKDVIASLITSCQKGVIVKVMLEEHPFGGGSLNQKTKQTLDGSCVQTKWTNSTFSLTHEKTIVIDGNIVFILNQNLTASAFSKNREYDIADTTLSDVTEIKKIFGADWNRSDFSQTDENLVVSPNSSREKLSALIASARQSIDTEVEVIDDPDMVHLLESKAQSVAVRLIVPDISQISANKKILVQLQQNGVEVKTLKSPYIHAKLILIDGAKAYIGSVNLTTQSMDSNREVGILISQQNILTELHQDFAADWEAAVPFASGN